jgi:hypothetical protein
MTSHRSILVDCQVEQDFVRLSPAPGDHALKITARGGIREERGASGRESGVSGLRRG